MTPAERDAVAQRVAEAQLVFEAMGVNPTAAHEKAVDTVVQSLWREKDAERVERMHQETVDAVRGKEPPEDALERARAELRRCGREMTVGVHLLRCVCLAFGSMLIFPAAMTAASGTAGARILWEGFAYTWCDCTEEARGSTVMNVPTYQSSLWFVYSLQSYVSGWMFLPYVSEALASTTCVATCLLLTIIETLVLVLAHRMIRALSLPKPTHGWLNAIVAFSIAMSLISRRYNRVDAMRCLVDLARPIMICNTLLAVAVTTFLRKAPFRDRKLSASRGRVSAAAGMNERIAEDEITLLGMVRSGAYYLSAAFAVYMGITNAS